MTPPPDYDSLLDRVDESRRDFLKKVVAGTVFAAPLMASFSMEGLSVDVADANVSNQLCSNMTGTSTPRTLYLDRDPGENLVLTDTPPTSATPRFRDSPSLSRANGNPWRAIGTWEAILPGCTGIQPFFPELDVWLGLRNSDDQGTRFDLKADLFANGTLHLSGEVHCIAGLTRNRAKAKEVVVTLSTFVGGFFGSSDLALAVRLSARIGTGNCPGHSSATGLRLYYDAASRDSSLDIVLFPPP